MGTDRLQQRRNNHERAAARCRVAAARRLATWVFFPAGQAHDGEDEDIRVALAGAALWLRRRGPATARDSA